MRAIATLLMLAASSPLLAQNFNYNYLEGSYSRYEFDNRFTDVDGDGFELRGSIEVGDMWHVFASYTKADLDFNTDIDQFIVGGGIHRPLMQALDLYFNLAYVNLDADGGGGSFDDDGLETTLGARWMFAPDFELSGGVTYTDVGDDDQLGLNLEGWYYLVPGFSVGLKTFFADERTQYGIGARYFF